MDLLEYNPNLNNMPVALTRNWENKENFNKEEERKRELERTIDRELLYLGWGIPNQITRTIIKILERKEAIITLEERRVLRLLKYHRKNCSEKEEKMFENSIIEFQGEEVWKEIRRYLER